MINPYLSWYQPQSLGRYPYRADLDAMPCDAGIYVFFRSHGDTRQIFYVGKALNLRSRIKNQFNNLKLMNGIEAAGNGARFVAYADIVLKPGQKKATAIAAAEKMLIRHFVDEGHELLNVQGVKLKLQTLTNERPKELKKIIPARTQAQVPK